MCTLNKHKFQAYTHFFPTVGDERGPLVEALQSSHGGLGMWSNMHQTAGPVFANRIGKPRKCACRAVCARSPSWGRAGLADTHSGLSLW